MTKMSIKKVSILGLVLIAASAVTAAILPNNTKVAGNGELKGAGFTSAGDQTCIQSNDPDNNNCNATAGSATTIGTNPGTSAINNGSSADQNINTSVGN
jgi:hypothetical protein